MELSLPHVKPNKSLSLLSPTPKQPLFWSRSLRLNNTKSTIFRERIENTTRMRMEYRKEKGRSMVELEGELGDQIEGEGEGWMEMEMEMEMEKEKEKEKENCKGTKTLGGDGGGMVELLECLEREAIMGEDQGREPNDYNRRAQIFYKSSKVFQALKEQQRQTQP